MQRAAQRKEQWWKRAEWALNLTLSDDPQRQELGLEVLDALSESEWKQEHESDVIAAAKGRFDPTDPFAVKSTDPHISWWPDERGTDDSEAESGDTRDDSS